MKKIFLLLALFSLHSIFSLPLQPRTIDPQALSQLTLALDISPDANLIEETQKRWLRKARKERWEIPELAPSQREFVLNWAAEQGLYSDWTPAIAIYDQALILGATTHPMEMRLNYLKHLWEQGIRFHEIVWLTGDRPLDPRVDALTDRCTTESAAAHILWNETPLPDEMRALPVRFIATPMKGDQRPNTHDTILAWLNTPHPATALFVSDQPFCGYQFAIINSDLPDTILFDLVGPGVDPHKHPAAAAITLDSLARWLYTVRE